MLKSDSLREHLLRGVIGFAALAMALAVAASHAWLALPLVVVALVSLRGCPTCWTVGLVQTIAARVAGRTPPATCVDGSCAVRDARRRLGS